MDVVTGNVVSRQADLDQVEQQIRHDPLYLDAETLVIPVESVATPAVCSASRAEATSASAQASVTFLW